MKRLFTLTSRQLCQGCTDKEISLKKKSPERIPQRFSLWQRVSACSGVKKIDFWETARRQRNSLRLHLRSSSDWLLFVASWLQDDMHLVFYPMVHVAESTHKELLPWKPPDVCSSVCDWMIYVLALWKFGKLKLILRSRCCVLAVGYLWGLGGGFVCASTTLQSAVFRPFCHFRMLCKLTFRRTETSVLLSGPQLASWQSSHLDRHF